MKWLFFVVVALACTLLGLTMILLDLGVLSASAICALGALAGFLVAYRMQSHYSILDD